MRLYTIECPDYLCSGDIIFHHVVLKAVLTWLLNDADNFVAPEELTEDTEAKSSTKGVVVVVDPLPALSELITASSVAIEPTTTVMVAIVLLINPALATEGDVAAVLVTELIAETDRITDVWVSMEPC